MIRAIGGDAVGMSSVPEAIIANHAGKEIIGISFLANMAAGVLDQPLSGEEVTEASRHITEKFSAVVDIILLSCEFQFDFLLSLILGNRSVLLRSFSLLSHI